MSGQASSIGRLTVNSLISFLCHRCQVLFGVDVGGRTSARYFTHQVRANRQRRAPASCVGRREQWPHRRGAVDRVATAAVVGGHDDRALTGRDGAPGRGATKGWSARPTTTPRRRAAATSRPSRSEVDCPSAQAGLWHTITRVSSSASVGSTRSATAPVTTMTGPIDAARAWASERSTTLDDASVPSRAVRPTICGGSPCSANRRRQRAGQRHARSAFPQRRGVIGVWWCRTRPVGSGEPAVR